jgi:hypothetical protein
MTSGTIKLSHPLIAARSMQYVSSFEFGPLFLHKPCGEICVSIAQPSCPIRYEMSFPQEATQIDT